MGKPINWHGTNKKLTAPLRDKDRIGELNVFNNGHVTVSCWQLTPSELADIVQNGGKIYVGIMFGPSQPPLFVGSEDTVREVAIDFGGVWKRKKV